MSQSSAKQQLSNSSRISSKNVDCSFALVVRGIQVKRKKDDPEHLLLGCRNGLLSTFVGLSSNSKELLIKMKTPLLCSVQCEKNIFRFR